MRALVTGSTGLLGNNLVRTLIDAGHEVWALARSKEKAQRELGDTAARVVLGDIRNILESWLLNHLLRETHSFHQLGETRSVRKDSSRKSVLRLGRPKSRSW
jgi:nucleoside-diphosphate-sugar epimerase